MALGTESLALGRIMALGYMQGSHAKGHLLKECGWPLRPPGSPLSTRRTWGSDRGCLCLQVVRVGLSPSQEPLIHHTKLGLAIFILFKHMVLN